MIFNQKWLLDEGFEGFYSVSELIKSPDHIPRAMGVYALLMPVNKKPSFVEVGSGGHFKQRDPNVPVTTLESKWVNGTDVLYIGKAGSLGSSANLHSRIKQYLKFGQGKPVGHWGGRYVWQIKESSSLRICWKLVPDQEPRSVEKGLIIQFYSHYGKLPFANLSS